MIRISFLADTSNLSSNDHIIDITYVPNSTSLSKCNVKQVLKHKIQKFKRIARTSYLGHLSTIRYKQKFEVQDFLAYDVLTKLNKDDLCSNKTTINKKNKTQ